MSHKNQIPNNIVYKGQKFKHKNAISPNALTAILPFL